MGGSCYQPRQQQHIYPGTLLNKVQIISDQKTWERTAARLASEPELAIDTESNSLYAYYERICLVQIGASSETFLLDPLEIRDFSALGQLLADPSILKVLHGASYDLRSLNRDYGTQVQPLFDTEIAARFLGTSSPNLALVLETFLGVKIPKSQKLQRSNWKLRPLSLLAIEYAASDVRHLLRLTQELRRQLAQADRLEWVQEECSRLEQTRYLPPDPSETAFLRIKGSNQLNARALAVLKELYLWRESEAQRLDWPPFRVVGNETLLRLAHFSTNNSNMDNLFLGAVSGLSPQLVKRAGDAIQAAVQRGLEGPAIHHPPSSRGENFWTYESRERLRRLKGWRSEWGASLKLDPALLWPTSSLERLALQPESWRIELLEEGNKDVRNWQRREFAQSLMEVLDVGA
jgi:ribonuclease D